MRAATLLVVAGALAACVPGASAGFYPQLDNCLLLNQESGLRLQWTVDQSSASITAVVQSSLQGWAGIGLQTPPRQTMGPGDFWTAWVTQGGLTVAQDRHLGSSPAFGLPPMDAQQSLLNAQGTMNDEGAWWVGFSRLLSTGDPDDVDLAQHGRNVSVLYAWGALPDGDAPAYHGPNRGRVVSVDFFSPSRCEPSPCKNDCSAHGKCNAKTATCACEDGWLGDDCSRRNLTAAMRLPEGFEITYFAQGVTNARFMTQSEADPSIVYVGSRTEGNVYAVIDADMDGVADKVVTVASGLLMPNGVLWLKGSLYVMQPSRLIRFDSIDSTYGQSPTYTVVNEAGLVIPTANGDWHAWKPLRVSPDGTRLFFTIGSPCNYCYNQTSPGNPTTTLHLPWGTIASVKLDGTDLQLHAAGIRNSVGFDFTPKGNIVFSENGRDEWGENLPQDELNYLDLGEQFPEPLKGKNFYGFPFCYGGTNGTNAVADPIFNPSGQCGEFRAAQAGLGAHVAPLGVTFYKGSQFPAAYRGQALVALHGSWNRHPGDLSGYKLVSVEFDPNNESVVRGVTTLAEGWLDADKTTKWGRPVDILQRPDGSILVSDDFGGSIFRISYRG